MTTQTSSLVVLLSLLSSFISSNSTEVAVWNCRGGLEQKLNEIQLLFHLSNCDILVLNETFRRSRTRWPSYFPPRFVTYSSDKCRSHQHNHKYPCTFSSNKNPSILIQKFCFVLNGQPQDNPIVSGLNDSHPGGL